MSGFDWPGLMQAGLRGLGLKPAEFWALTPAELRVMLGETKGGATLVREHLDALIKAYPDTRGETDDE